MARRAITQRSRLGVINDFARLDHHLPTDRLRGGTKDILFLYPIKLLLHLYYGSRSLHRIYFRSGGNLAIY